MTAMTAMNVNRFSCCSTAVATASAHMLPLLDTAIGLVVSICVLCLFILRIMGGNL